MLHTLHVTLTHKVTVLNMALVTAKQAEKLTGKTRQTFWRDAKSGKISVHKDKDGSNLYEPSELERVYGLLNESNSSNTTKLPDETHEKTEILHQKTEFLQEKINILEKQLQKSEEREERAQEQIGKLNETISRQTHLLEHHQKKEAQKPVEQQTASAAPVTPPKGSNTLLWAFVAVLGVIAAFLLMLAFRPELLSGITSIAQ